MMRARARPRAPRRPASIAARNRSRQKNKIKKKRKRKRKKKKDTGGAVIRQSSQSGIIPRVRFVAGPGHSGDARFGRGSEYGDARR